MSLKKTQGRGGGEKRLFTCMECIYRSITMTVTDDAD